MQFDPRPLLGGDKAKIVANLPYNIATALLIDWLSVEPWPPWYDMMVLMFQREVAERIVAREDDEAYGRLGVLANWRAETKILFDISPAAFVPQPKVTSSVVRLVPRAAPEPATAGRSSRSRRRRSASGEKCCGKASNRWRSIRPGWPPPRMSIRPRRAETVPVARLCCHGPRIDRYTERKTEPCLRREPPWR